MPDRPGGRDAAVLADFADLMLNVGRLVRARTPADTEAVQLTETERTIMRIVDLFPGASPSEIADRARVRRSNVSAALRSLEGKKMIERSETSGRGIAVRPTPHAAHNLQRLRDAWAGELNEPLADDLDEVRECVTLLSRLEKRLIQAHRS